MYWDHAGLDLGFQRGRLDGSPSKNLTDDPMVFCLWQGELFPLPDLLVLLLCHYISTNHRTPHSLRPLYGVRLLIHIVSQNPFGWIPVDRPSRRLWTKTHIHQTMNKTFSLNGRVQCGQILSDIWVPSNIQVSRIQKDKADIQALFPVGWSPLTTL